MCGEFVLVVGIRDELVTHDDLSTKTGLGLDSRLRLLLELGLGLWLGLGLGLGLPQHCKGSEGDGRNLHNPRHTLKPRVMARVRVRVRVEG